MQNEKHICARCFIDLPETGFFKDLDNPVLRLFSGRVHIINAAAAFYFQKGTHLQHIIHQVKYRGKKDAGFELGKLIGQGMMDSPFASVDLVVPVPLHPSKERKRGFNQSALIAAGIATTLNKTLNERALERTKATSTQTKKGRYERWLNVDSVFRLANPGELSNQHILLVDDIITTGATLEACAQALLEEKGVQVSIAALAYARL